MHLQSADDQQSDAMHSGQHAVLLFHSNHDDYGSAVHRNVLVAMLRKRYIRYPDSCFFHLRQHRLLWVL